MNRCGWGKVWLTLAALLWPTFTANSEPAPLHVFVSLPPQAYFVKKVGGEGLRVSVLVRPGASPHTYEPKPQQVVGLSAARLYFAIGVPFERAWLPKIRAANPAMVVVDTDRGMEKLPMKADLHAESPSDPHEGVRDPHVWLSPPLVMLQARHILRALEEADPEGRSGYEVNYRRFMGELLELDEELRSLFSQRAGGKAFMVFHPAWGYFADAYGLEQIPIELEGKEPRPAELRALIDDARRRGVRAVFVAPQQSRKSAEVIAGAVGGVTVEADPLAPDWAANLRRVAARFKAELR